MSSNVEIKMTTPESLIERVFGKGIFENREMGIEAVKMLAEKIGRKTEVLSEEERRYIETNNGSSRPSIFEMISAEDLMKKLKDSNLLNTEEEILTQLNKAYAGLDSVEEKNVINGHLEQLENIQTSRENIDEFINQTENTKTNKKSNKPK